MRYPTDPPFHTAYRDWISPRDLSEPANDGSVIGAAGAATLAKGITVRMMADQIRTVANTMTLMAEVRLDAVSAAISEDRESENQFACCQAVELRNSIA